VSSTPQSPKEDLIDPKDLIERYSIEELNTFSDDYYRKLLLPEFQLGKPFSMPVDVPQHLVRLGLILENLRAGPGSRILDFGAGTCWISKSLWQMGCDVTAVDVSEEALRLGRRLFEDYPIPMKGNGDWHLKLFDGHRLPLEDNSVDRIICYDTFHHVPNQEVVIKEFYRVLSDGGMIALNEPIGPHSQSEASQKEMRNFKVLENDLLIDELVDQFTSVGFGDPRFKVVPAPKFTMNLAEWKSTSRQKPPKNLNVSISDFAAGCAIMFFEKGKTRYDSRQSDGLSHSISVSETKLSTKINEPVWLTLKIKNAGTAIWLHGTGTKTGIVNIGTQQLDPTSKAFIAEHARFHLDHDIEPGEEIEMTVPIIFRAPGKHMLRLDLVSELVCWFHDIGSKPIYLEATVSE